MPQLEYFIMGMRRLSFGHAQPRLPITMDGMFYVPCVHLSRRAQAMWIALCCGQRLVFVSSASSVQVKW